MRISREVSATIVMAFLQKSHESISYKSPKKISHSYMFFAVWHRLKALWCVYFLHSWINMLTGYHLPGERDVSECACTNRTPARTCQWRRGSCNMTDFLPSYIREWLISPPPHLPLLYHAPPQKSQGKSKSH